ncbi:response regulator transcription factor [Paenibacillus mesophilus]|uniref:response regulator transcription factor n=1 Tax=Paenibacillus mesophilus TaxID=2582849 RepID=UPI00110E7C90|nr:response regulator transcription factor [Paenibacillus mesophilus]TMV52193.1 response regulator transcription factor [Paenibacillus mesophilus]
MSKILIVDDDLAIRKLIKAFLQQEGFATFEAANGQEALDVLGNVKIDLIVLDIMMPVMDGWDFCRDLKKTMDVPIIMVTAKGEIAERLKGFQLGTDDYMVKPFDPMELVMRVKALLKRYRIEHSETVQVGDVTIDRKTFELTVNGISSMIPPKEFELLFKFASNPGHIFTRAQLIEQIWGVDYEGDARTVDVHVKRLREKLEQHASEKVSIITIRNLGYRLEVHP